MEGFSLDRSFAYFFRHGTKGGEMKCFEEENEPQEKERVTKVGIGLHIEPHSFGRILKTHF